MYARPKAGRNAEVLCTAIQTVVIIMVYDAQRQSRHWAYFLPFMFATSSRRHVVS